ncbi:PTS sugar transporter subunit IIA [Lactobacillus sp. ESL0791]|uniref:BglG family transcription antiterminator n=1 Tax=Lactobacillus sp. ESL0791 TaxID=2983234 RepID=UPI0023F752BE|nr:PTS sugar transporter subunit IIA [Lactobacillus sp. ESL0791]MDF7639548.1 PTS sugar transporter subunit IIA [Lactobacillus sp. ESL0791]
MVKKDALLEYLRKYPGWHTSQELAVMLGVSNRTVKTYVQQLKQEGCEIVSGTKGYSLHNTDMLHDHEKNCVPRTSKERVNFIINFFVKNSSAVNLYDLSEKLFVSESAILQDFKKVQSKIKPFGLELQRNGDFWSLVGNESQKRHLLSSLIYSESAGSFNNQDIIQKNFPQIDVDKLKKIILEESSKENIYLNTFDVNNILLHFVIAIDRINQGHEINNGSVDFDFKNNKLGLQIVDRVADEFNIQFSVLDRYELALIIQGALNNKADFAENISSETRALVMDLIDYVWKNYEINLDIASFKKFFSMHLDRLITRSRQQKSNYNPIAKNIKFYSPTIYECAVIIAHRITTKAKIRIDDNEIAYIAMHVGNAIAEQISDRQKLAVAIMIPKYYNNAAVLSNKLQGLEASYINIKDIIYDPNQIKKLGNKIDLLISVDSDYVDSKISTVSISQFLLANDIQALNVAITTKQHQIKKDHFQEKLLRFFDSKNFVVSDDLKTIDQVFELVTNNFVQQGVVDESFINLLFQRESMSSTAFGRVAIPHSLNMSAKKSSGFIIINSHGIKWSGGNEVFLIIALAIDPNNKQLFREVFDELSNVVTDINNVTKLINCKNYSEFIVKLVDLL